MLVFVPGVIVAFHCRRRHVSIWSGYTLRSSPSRSPSRSAAGSGGGRGSIATAIANSLNVDVSVGFAHQQHHPRNTMINEPFVAWVVHHHLVSSPSNSSNTLEKSLSPNPDRDMMEYKLYVAAPSGSGALTPLAASAARPKSFCISLTPNPPV